ncbi:MAG: AAA+ family ATPase [Gemmobacter sp.]|jgi:hypothetical protein|nr:AAA+ family ATPase [Gemmobacter sp.]
MIRCLAPIALALSLGAAFAQDDPPPTSEPPGLMERGVEMFLRGLMEEMAPTMRDMEEALRDLQPQAQKLMEMIGDFRNYEMPEMLPNGDILIRRKPPALPPAPPPGGEVEL